MVEDLARRFEVSAQTIRKDMDDLCDHRSPSADEVIE
jgi:DeoR family glycerol-3-phosphate regulon repressor